MLETERFLLRPIEESDADALFEITSDEEVTRYMRFWKHNSVTETLDLIKDYHANKDYAYSVIEKGTNNYVGVFCLKINHENAKDLELSIYCGRNFWNKGINTELMKYFVENSNKLYGIETLTAHVIEANKVSSHMCEKCGFVLVKKMKSTKFDGFKYLYVKNLV